MLSELDNMWQKSVLYNLYAMYRYKNCFTRPLAHDCCMIFWKFPFFDACVFLNTLLGFLVEASFCCLEDDTFVFEADIDWNSLLCGSALLNGWRIHLHFFMKADIWMDNVANLKHCSFYLFYSAWTSLPLLTVWLLICFSHVVHSLCAASCLCSLLPK